MFLISIFSLFVSTTSAQTEKKTDTISAEFKNDMAVVFGKKDSAQKTAALEYALWTDELQKYLLDSDDDFAKAITLAAKVSTVQNSKLIAKINQNNKLEQQLNDLSYQPIADALNMLLTQNDLSADALDVLSDVCFNKEIKDHCHTNILLQKRMQADSDNLQVYLRPFAMSTQANNHSTSEKLLALMANTKKSKTTLLITPETNLLIDQFLADNPVPKSYIEGMIIDYKKLSGVSAATKAKLIDLMPNYMPAFVKNSLRHLNDLPPYKPLMDYCKKHATVVVQCRDIARIMIQKSNSMIDKGIGHAVLIASFEATGDIAGAKSAKELSDQFKTSYKCIQKLGSGPHFMDNYFDPTYQKITMETTDEYEMIIQLAEYRYKKLKAQGDESAVDPNTCFDNQPQPKRRRQ